MRFLALRIPSCYARTLVDTVAHAICQNSCNICNSQGGNRFFEAGALTSRQSGCDHAFCLSCIRGWRREREQQAGLEVRVLSERRGVRDHFPYGGSLRLSFILV